MLTIDELLGAYDDGDITRGELFGHILAALTLADVDTIRARLATEAGRVEAFEEWVLDVAAGAEILLGSQPLRIPDEARAAIARLRDRIRVERYGKLASRIRRWTTEEQERERASGSEDIAAFRSTDVDALLVEAA